jgi:hypothetical protein
MSVPLPVSPVRGPPTDWAELVQVHFRPRRLSGTDRRAARHRHPHHLTATGGSASMRPPGGRTRRASAQTPEKRHSRGGRHVGRERPGAHPGDRSTRLTSRSSVGRCFQKCHWPGYPFPPADRRLPGARAGGPGLRAEPSAAAPRCGLRPDFQGFGKVLDNFFGGGSLPESGCRGSSPRGHIKRIGSAS